MKKLILLFSVFLLTISSAFAQQQIYWTEVALEVTPGKASLVYKLVDDFYSSIDFPEGSSLTLNDLDASKTIVSLSFISHSS